MFFLSSPTPPPPSSPFEVLASTTSQQSSRRASFSKSHNHDNSTYGRAHARAFYDYAPHSPSPLRTTRNANLMSSPPQLKGGYGHTSSLLSSSPLRSGFLENQDENKRMESSENEEEENYVSTPSGKTNFGSHGCNDRHPSLITPPDSGSNHHNFNSTIGSHEQWITKTSISIPSSANPTRLTTISTTTSSHQNPPSQWELRSRSSSPSSLLTSQTNRNREQRRSKFLDRIRRRRDDERSEQVGEQVLRMDFVKERRGWEMEMARRAAMEASQQEEIESDDDDDEYKEDEEELSPTQEYEEDVEVDELVREYERENLRVMRDDEFVVEDAEDEEYERLFREMEILSQHSQSQSQSQDPPPPAPQPQQHEYELAHRPGTHTKQAAFPREPPPSLPLQLPQHGATAAINDETMDLS
ncbi:uncharacterized protein Z520_12387 [Fonsecaea multimorphosa CBS 102226]|uniref:Uncharacterized protein n=1 Tax=Fonsecaea multimorphosa CBS 102226 TaxID=1442371 RepID=A0A0D2K696_9EURO|nr:uncharacterized protein Z520_12387 [Fonsecaea multimorphosa CBS 102226]KIX91898.1 hypothetical protein Z520_12387 [Fonsecaea multimorphosa CBS 102226]OAL17220.1 hypothetical protein AYO22_11869 [Fonsecaea multimorphosa]